MPTDHIQNRSDAGPKVAGSSILLAAIVATAFTTTGDRQANAAGTMPRADLRSTASRALLIAPNVIKIRSSGTQGIAVLVNDDPVTNYEIQQRQRYLSLGSGDIQAKARSQFKSMISDKSTTEKLRDILREIIKANQGKSKDQILAIFEQRKKAFAKSIQEKAVANARSSVLPGLRKKAVDELIEERLKLQEAKRLNVIAGDDEVDRLISGMAQRNKMDIEKFSAHMKSMGADINTLKSRFKAMLSWRNVIKRQFGHQIAISTRDLDRAVASTEADDQTELNVQLVTLLFDSSLGQTALAQRLNEADALRSKFTGCSSTSTLAKNVGGARFKNLGPTEAGQIPEPARTMLINANDGEMLPANVGAQGVELWVLCGRKTVGADDAKRDAAAEDLRQREFQVLAERHLSDLRQEAHIEYR